MFSMFNIPNFFTAGNMLCGIISILLSVSGRIDLAPYPIFLGAVLDFFDGFLARLLNKQGELGKQLDSFADMVTFGVAPGIMMMVLLIHIAIIGTDQVSMGILWDPDKMWLIGEFRNSFAMWSRNLFDRDFSMVPFSVLIIPFSALIIPFMSMFRLAKFNLDTRQSVSFIGLPTPANTIFFTAFPLIYVHSFTSGSAFEKEIVSAVFQPAVLIPIMVVMSLLLLAEIPLFALKFKHFKWKKNEIRYLFLILCAILIPTLLVWSIPIIVLLYIVLSVIENIFFKNKQHEIQS